MPANESKINRLLLLQHLLFHENVINKQDFSAEHSVTEKTVQRDISVLNCFYSELSNHTGEKTSVEYSREKQGYVLHDENDIKLNREQVLATSKIVLESRAFCKDEMSLLLDALLLQVEKKSQKEIRDVIDDEKFNYVPLHHNKPLFHLLYQASDSIRNCRKVNLSYIKKTSEQVVRTVLPVSVTFSEYYFYLIAFRDDEEYKMPTIYRLDRIEKIEQTAEKFFIPYSERFKDGEFRKRVQFMYSGDIIKVKFNFTGETVEPVLERLPTARVISQEGDTYTVEAEVYGTGIKMWLLSQGSKVSVIGPEPLVEEMREEISRMAERY
jgi:predicted DNA-binding transcriptional regulator YafY